MKHSVCCCFLKLTTMEGKSGLLNGLFKFKKLPDCSVDKSKVKYDLCQKEFNYHRSTSTLSYHLHAKHPGAAGSPQPGELKLRQNTVLECAGRRRPMDESTSKKLTKAIAKWVATDCRPVLGTLSGWRGVHLTVGSYMKPRKKLKWMVWH